MKRTTALRVLAVLISLLEVGPLWTVILIVSIAVPVLFVRVFVAALGDSPQVKR
jgi:hypothetical protein